MWVTVIVLSGRQRVDAQCPVSEFCAKLFVNRFHCSVGASIVLCLIKSFHELYWLLNLTSLWYVNSRPGFYTKLHQELRTFGAVYVAT